MDLPSLQAQVQLLDQKNKIGSEGDSLQKMPRFYTLNCPLCKENIAIDVQGYQEANYRVLFHKTTCQKEEENVDIDRRQVRLRWGSFHRVGTKAKLRPQKTQHWRKNHLLRGLWKKKSPIREERKQATTELQLQVRPQKERLWTSASQQHSMIV